MWISKKNYLQYLFVVYYLIKIVVRYLISVIRSAKFKIKYYEQN